MAEPAVGDHFVDLIGPRTNPSGSPAGRPVALRRGGKISGICTFWALGVMEGQPEAVEQLSIVIPQNLLSYTGFMPS